MLVGLAYLNEVGWAFTTLVRASGYRIPLCKTLPFSSVTCVIIAHLAHQHLSPLLRYGL